MIDPFLCKQFTYDANEMEFIDYLYTDNIQHVS